MDISPEKMQIYRKMLRNRVVEERQACAARRERAWSVALQAAALLKEQFGVHQVMVFGSLAHGHWFTMTSDIDLAAWGINDDAYLVALSRLLDLSPEFSIDLVPIERCKPAIRESILKDGQLL